MRNKTPPGVRLIDTHGTGGASFGDTGRQTLSGIQSVTLPQFHAAMQVVMSLIVDIYATVDAKVVAGVILIIIVVFTSN